MPLPSRLPRRRFLQLASAAASACATPAALAFAPQGVAIVVDPSDAVASSAPVGVGRG